jgi:hypothetical protein
LDPGKISAIMSPRTNTVKYWNPASLAIVDAYTDFILSSDICYFEPLRAGMNALTIQTLLGHEDLTMTKHYAEMVDDGLLQAHKQHSLVDNLK